MTKVVLDYFDKGLFFMKLNRFFYRLFLFLLAGPLTSLLFSTYLLANNKKIKVASVEYLPYYGAKLLERGPITEIVVAALEAAGYKKENIDITFMTWARAIDSTKKGKYHALMTAWYSEDRIKDFHYSDPLPPNELGLYTFTDGKKSDAKINAVKPYTDSRQLFGFRIGIVNGYVNPKQISDYKDKLELFPVKDDSLNIRKLASKRLDFVMIDKQMGTYLLGQPEIREILDKTGAKPKWYATFESKDQFLIFPKSIHKSLSANQNYEGNIEGLIKEFNKGLAKIKGEGKLKAIYQKHKLLWD